ncbi:AP-4 complex subunit epsilon, putative [Babesia caballi]|uniref:AP-4 complex subunit epsilon, putative n=1 Tax=Babesia caballi TaxID=5871 RepID=A0AAV4LPI4_BABCB|nr:AP-4 complex subunit epsilon, putative [Babesia caballi]
MSREFYKFTRALGEARSKEEEERIVLGQIGILKERFLEKDVDRERFKEYLVRAVYVEMLGFEAPFAHIHAINMAQERSLVCKKAGYWACRQLLKPQSELMLLLINTLQKDLQSPNFMEVACALQCVCDLVNREMVPTILPRVLQCLDHEHELVRKHAIMAVRSFNDFDSTCVEDLTSIIERGICDPNPAVMGCTLSLLQDALTERPRGYRNLVPSLVSILNQIVARRLTNTYDYHRVPAPWIQIAIVSIFGRMGRGDRRLSAQMFECLQNVMQHAESLPSSSSVVGNAIIYECAKTVSAISPRESLTTMCSISISRMLGSANNNLRYAGISGLSILVGVNMSYAAENQLVVVSCLEDRDETIRRRTLDLLYRMTNTKNVVTIVNCFVAQLRSKCERYWSAELINKTTLLCEKFAPSAVWYVETLLELMMVASDMLTDEILFSTVNVLKENVGDAAFCSAVLAQVAKLVKRADALPEIVVKVVSWVYANFPLCGVPASHSEQTTARTTQEASEELNGAPGVAPSDADEYDKHTTNTKDEAADDVAEGMDDLSLRSPMDNVESTPEKTLGSVSDATDDTPTDATDRTPTRNQAKALLTTSPGSTPPQSQATPPEHPSECEEAATTADLDSYIGVLLRLVKRYRQNSSTVCWVLGCMRTLIIANEYRVSADVDAALCQLEGSNCANVTQCCKEIRVLCALRPHLKLHFEDYDRNLSFLQDHIRSRLEAGARPYAKPDPPTPSDPDPAHASPVPELRFEPYAMKSPLMEEYQETLTAADLVNEELVCKDVPRSWGPSGYVGKDTADASALEEPDPAPVEVPGAAKPDSDSPTPAPVEPSIDMSILSGGARAPKAAERKNYVWKKPEPREPSRKQVEMARALFQGLVSSEGTDTPNTFGG